MPKTKWQYDEMQQVGVDFTDERQVEAFDQKMARGDIAEEVEEIVKALDLKPNHTLLDIGTGTGEFAIELARRCEKVYANDVSKAMIDYAKQKAKSQNILNISFYHAGFLTYEHSGPPVDAVISQFVLHHLPDFWKVVALRRTYHILKTGGKFFLEDVVFSFGIDAYQENIEAWIERGKRFRNSFSEDEWCAHIRDEYSTYDWMVEGMLRQAGFTINEANYWGGFYATYLCTKD